MDILIKIAYYGALMYGIQYVVDGVSVQPLWPTAVIAGLVFFLVNTLIKPIIKLLTLPINVLTLGLFTIIVNAFVFWQASYIVNGFDVTTVSAALFGGFLAAIGAWIISMLLDTDGKGTFAN